MEKFSQEIIEGEATPPGANMFCHEEEVFLKNFS